MITKLTKNLLQFYQISLVVIMVAILSTIFYFWKLGLIDGSRSKDLHESSYILENISQSKPLSEIRQIVFEENSKFALKNLKILNDKFTKVNELVDSKSFSDLEKESEQIKVGITNLVSFPKTNKVIDVLSDKLEKFHDYVKEHNWNTLTRSTTRLLISIKGHINKEKIHLLVNNVNKEFDDMQKITENSILSKEEKSEVVRLIDKMRVETIMLKKYVDERSFLFDLLNNFKKSIKNWVNEVNPKISLMKIEAEQVGRYYVFGLLLLLGLASVLFGLSFIVNKFLLKKSQDGVEKRFKKYVQENIIEATDAAMDDFSEEFKTFTFHTAKYVNKRMSFGAIFQDTLPIASVLLDQNLKVIWANRHFAEQWDIKESEITKDYLSWDYLAKMTNISEDDPVLEALKNGIAGIYQVQIKVAENTEAMPYEMYVSPVRYNYQNRIQLFFYPLASLQQTINEQAMSIVNPIERTLELMLSNQYDDYYQDQLHRDYEIAGILDVYDKFNSLENSRRSERSTMLDELEILHAKVEQLIDVISKVDLNNLQLSDVIREKFMQLKSFRESIVGLSIAGKTFEQISTEANELLNRAIATLGHTLQENIELTHFVQESANAFPVIDEVKDELKIQKQTVSDSRARLSHSISQFIHLKKKITDRSISERFNNTLHRVQEEFKILDDATAILDKKITSIEVILSKSQLLFASLNEKASSLNINESNELYQSYRAQVQGLIQESKQYLGVIDCHEDEIVTQMESMFTSTKETMSQVKQTKDLISPHVPHDIEHFSYDLIDSNPNNHTAQI